MITISDDPDWWNREGPWRLEEQVKILPSAYRGELYCPTESQASSFPSGPAKVVLEEGVEVEAIDKGRTVIVRPADGDTQ